MVVHDADLEMECFTGALQKSVPGSVVSYVLPAMPFVHMSTYLG